MSQLALSAKLSCKVSHLIEQKGIGRPRITIRVAPALLDAVYFNVGRQPRVKHRLGMVEETTDCLTVSITILLLILDFISMLEAICDPGHYLVRQS